jgi:hypothetical protein
MMRVVASTEQTASSSEQTTSCSPLLHHFRDVLLSEAAISRNGANEPYSSPDCESRYRHFLQVTLPSPTNDLFRLRGGAKGLAIIIPNLVQVLNESSMVDDWPKESGTSAVTFESNSQLNRIEEPCFRDRHINSICLPRSLEALGRFCFMNAKIHSISYKPRSMLTQIEGLCFSGSSLKCVCFPESIEVLQKSRFGYSAIEELTFEAESNLRQLQDKCFQNCTLDCICLPNSVRIIGKSCSASGCVKILTFEAERRVRRIKESCFSDSLKPIHIPHSVELLGKSCFDQQTSQTVKWEKMTASNGL